MTKNYDNSDKLFGFDMPFTDDMKKRLRETIFDIDFEFLHNIEDMNLARQIMERLIEDANDIFCYIHVEDMLNRVFNNLDGLEAEFDVKLTDLTRGLFSGVICTFVVTERDNYIQRKKDAFRAKIKQK